MEEGLKKKKSWMEMKRQRKKEREKEGSKNAFLRVRRGELE